MAVHPSFDRRAHHQLLRLVENYADEELMRGARSSASFRSSRPHHLKLDNHIDQEKRATEELRTKRRDLVSEFESASAELEQLKETRIAAQEEARELHVELETLEAAVHFKQAKLSSQQQEISKTNTLLKKLEDEEMCIRDHFTKTMMEINTTVRTMQSANSVEPLQLDKKSTRNASTNLDTSQPCGKPGIAKTSSNEGVRQEDQVSELLRKITAEEALLLTIRTNLNNQHEKLQHSRDKEEAYMESIGQATRDLASTRNQSEDLENLVASLTTDLQELHVCRQCGTDNIGQVTG